MIAPGEKFGKLTVVKLVVAGDANHRKYLCSCQCGGEKIVSEDNLRRGHTKSCGCILRTRNGESHTRLYAAWLSMLNRCYRGKTQVEKHYQKRGITVCDEWRNSFASFKQWAESNGYSDSLSLDRIDNNAGYSPENCRWATQKQQANNTSQNVYVEWNGKVRTISEWADYAGLPYGLVRNRIARGWDMKKALRPKGKYTKKKGVS